MGGRMMSGGRVVKNGEDRRRLVIQWILVTAM